MKTCEVVKTMISNKGKNICEVAKELKMSPYKLAYLLYAEKLNAQMLFRICEAIDVSVDEVYELKRANATK